MNWSETKLKSLVSCECRSELCECTRVVCWGDTLVECFEKQAEEEGSWEMLEARLEVGPLMVARRMKADY